LAVTARFTVYGEAFKALVNALEAVDGEFGKFTSDGFRVVCLDPSRTTLLDCNFWSLDYECSREVWVTWPLKMLEDVAKKVKKKEALRVEVRDGDFYVGVFKVGDVVEEEDVSELVLTAYCHVETLKATYPKATLKVDLPMFRRVVKNAEAYKTEGYWRRGYEYAGFKVEDRMVKLVFFTDKDTYSIVEARGFADWLLNVEGEAEAVYRLDKVSSLLILGLGEVATLEVRKENILRVGYLESYWSVDFYLAPCVGEPQKVFMEILEKPKPMRSLVWRMEGATVKDYVNVLKAVDALSASGLVKVGTIGDDAWVYWSDGGKGYVKISKHRFEEFVYFGEPFFCEVQIRDFLNFLRDAEKVECFLEGEPPSAMVFVASGAKIPTKEFKSEEVVKEYAVPEVKGVTLFSASTRLLSEIVEDALTAEEVFLVFASSPYEVRVLGINRIYYEASLPVDSVQVLEEDYVPTVALETLRTFFSVVPAEKVSVGKVDYSLFLEAETKIGPLKAIVFQSEEQLREALTFYAEYSKPPPPPKPEEVKPLAAPPPVAPPPVPEKVSREEFMRSFDEALYEWIPHFVEGFKPGFRGNLHYEAPEFEEEYVARFSMDTVLEKFKDEIARKKDEEWEHYSSLYASSPDYAQKWYADLSTLVHHFAADIVKKTMEQLFEEAKAKAKAVVPPEKRPLREVPEQVRELAEELEKESYASFISAGLPREEWLKHRGSIIEEIRSAIDFYGGLLKLEAEEKVRERVVKFISRLIERVKAVPPTVVPPAVIPAEFPPAVEVVYAPREKPISPEEMEAIRKELGVTSMGELLDKILSGAIKPEDVKKVHEELMMKRRVEKK
jgi:hypothetical protein